ncbi:hypothetical protein LDENG_00055810 [Lucifuga dentata]|nr:hypothetical protein LDENG_00055810 [Lucifuga dentata]
MLWEMIVSNLTCMKIEYIRLKHAKWLVWFFKYQDCSKFLLTHKSQTNCISCTLACKCAK